MFNFICRRNFLTHLGDYFSTISSSPIHRQFSLSLSSSSSSSSTLSSLSYSNSSKEDSFAVNYLINSCGLPPKSALLASKHLNIKTPKKPDSVLAFFKAHGFTNTQIARVVKSNPKFLLCKPQKTLLPKLEFFSSLGLSSTDLARVITAAPYLLYCSLENKIIPSYNIFRDLLQSDERTISMIKLYPGILAYDLQLYVLPNIKILRDVGVPESNIINHLTHHPGSLRTATSRFRRIVEEVKEMGFNPLKYMFMEAFHALISMSKSTWEKKVEVYKRWGWSEDDILLAFGNRPLCMMVSEDKITRVMDFLINKIGIEYSLLVKYPILFSFSLQKKTVPRCLLYKVLLDKGLLKKDKDVTLIYFLVTSENVFLNRIKMRFKEEAPQLLKLYQAFRQA